MQVSTIRNNYLQDRIVQLDLGDSELKIRGRTSASDHLPGEYDVLTCDETGNIIINYPSLTGDLHLYTKGNKSKPYFRTRFSPENIQKIEENGQKAHKYHTERGSGTRIFWPPLIVKKYLQKTPIDTLYIIEGEFKALSGAHNGLNICAIQGIHNFIQKTSDENKILNAELTSFIAECKVRNLVFVADSDCLDIHFTDENKDLAKRLSSFYSAIRNFRELTKSLNIDVYFSHLKPELNSEFGIKGLDDLFFARKEEAKSICEDIGRLQQSNSYFITQNITENSLKKLVDYFNLRNENAFYEAYQEILEQKPFTFKGTKYRHNGEQLEILSIPEAKQYLRIGDNYFEKVNQPNKEGNIQPAIVPRKKGTILDDHKKKAPNILEMIKKYKGFCNVPNNFNYCEEVHGFFNFYQPVPCKPEPGDITNSITLVRHIFGDQFELGLDYLQLLYMRPTQVLPILCLVSKEQETGKTTFAEWLRDLFGNNVTSITNQDLEGSFNDNYATKLVIYVDETFIDKKQIKERIKNLSTAGTITVNTKNIAKQEVDFFGKFILCSNNERDFINIESQDVRFWVRKISPIAQKNTDFKKLLKEEAPAFLHYLANRTLSVPKAKTRMWFDFNDIKTEALMNVVAESKDVIYKTIKDVLTECFDYLEGIKELCFTSTDLIAFIKMKNIPWITPTKLNKVLEDEYSIKSSQPMNYEYFNVWDPLNPGMPTGRKGRVYKFTRDMFT